MANYTLFDRNRLVNEGNGQTGGQPATQHTPAEYAAKQTASPANTPAQSTTGYPGQAAAAGTASNALGNLIGGGSTRSTSGTSGGTPAYTAPVAPDINPVLPENSYQAQLDKMYADITGQGSFNYDLNADGLYQMYRDMYMQNGRQAMMDTMGQAAALTGGYGNSYANTVGNQAYQQWMTQLNSVVPDLYDRAYQRYSDNLDRMMNMYQLTMPQAEAEREYAYKIATALLGSGQMPSAETLAMAGISAQDAQTMWSMMQPQPSGGGGYSSGRNANTGGAGLNGTNVPSGLLAKMAASAQRQQSGGTGAGNTGTPANDYSGRLQGGTGAGGYNLPTVQQNGVQNYQDRLVNAANEMRKLVR